MAPSRLLSGCLAVLVALCVVEVGTVNADDDPGRPIRMDDFFALEPAPAGVSFSPDGRAVAFVRTHPLTALPPREQSALVLEEGGDIWLQDAPGRPARNLTRGQADASRWWGPSWSPDGQRLAFLSTRGDRVGVWIWDRASDQVRPVSRDAVVMPREEAFRWITSREILCFGPLEGESGQPRSRSGETVDAAIDGWTRAARGEVTASVVDSVSFPLPSRRLFLVDVETGGSRQVAEVAGYGRGVPLKSWWLSPTGQALMVMRNVAARFGLTAASAMGNPRAVELRWLDGRVVRLGRPLPDNVLTDTVAWSPGGDEVAFFAYGDAPINLAVLHGRPAAAIMPEHRDEQTAENPAKLWSVNLASGDLRRIETAEFDLGYLGAPRIAWTAAGEILLRASKKNDAPQRLNDISRRGAWSNQNASLRAPASHNWWILRPDGSSRPLTTTVPSVPDTLQVIDRGKAALATIEHELWRIDLATGGAKNLTVAFSPLVVAVRQVLSPDVGELSDVVLTTRTWSQDLSVNVLFNLSSGVALSLAPPVAGARIVAFAPASRSVAYLAEDFQGTVLWRTAPGMPADVLLETNHLLRGIAKREMRIIEFTSAHDQVLRGVLLLPPGFSAARRYPLVAVAYISRRLGANGLPPMPEMLDLIAAAGYAVLDMEIPANPPGLDSEPAMSMAMLTSSVLPAVDKAIQMGIVDADRLFALGHSEGGWSVAALLPQTTRFKAAVAWAGSYDQLTVETGALPRNVGLRYQTSPHIFASPTNTVKRFNPTEIPWWRELAERRQSNPLVHVERIQTPLLMLHGDLDRVAIEPAEDLFNALVSMRKRAQFVRYWGEGHVFQSPSNRRDAYQRIFAWFDDFGDIARDAKGNMIFSGEKVLSRRGAPALTPADFARVGPVACLSSGDSSVSTVKH